MGVLVVFGGGIMCFALLIGLINWMVTGHWSGGDE